MTRSARARLARALRELSIALLPAQFPQARGRSGRMFRTLHQRLPKELRVAGITKHDGCRALPRRLRFARCFRWPSGDCKPLRRLAANPLFSLARPEGLEPPTHCLEGSCSVRLSYGRTQEKLQPEHTAGVGKTTVLAVAVRPRCDASLNAMPLYGAAFGTASQAVRLAAASAPLAPSRPKSGTSSPGQRIRSASV